MTLIGLYIGNSWRIIIALVIVTPLGFLTKFYSGPGEAWVNNSLGGVLYVIFWILLFTLLFPRTRSWKVASIVFAVTCALEFLQLWHPLFLEKIRSTFLGGTLLGNSFVWSDLPHYLAGALLAVILLPFLKNASANDVYSYKHNA